ncbi:CASR protein, partial [Polypterus senegalus]
MGRRKTRRGPRAVGGHMHTIANDAWIGMPGREVTWKKEPPEDGICNKDLSDLPGFIADGDIVIGGLFPMHYRIDEPDQNLTYKPTTPRCHGLNFRELRFAQTMRFAVEEINNRTDLLPGVELGYKIYDSCGSVPMALKAALDFASGPFPSNYNQSCLSPYFASGIIGETASSTTVAVASTVGPLQIALV